MLSPNHNPFFHIHDSILPSIAAYYTIQSVKQLKGMICLLSNK